MNLRDSLGYGRFLCEECLQTNDSKPNQEIPEKKSTGSVCREPPGFFPKCPNIFRKPTPRYLLGFEAMLPPATNQLRHRHTLEFLNLAPTTVKKLPVFVQQLPRNLVCQCLFPFWKGALVHPSPKRILVKYFK